MKPLAILCVILAVLVVGFYSYINLIGKTMNTPDAESELPEIEQMMSAQRTHMEEVQRDQKKMLEENRRAMDEQRRQMQDLRRQQGH